MSRPDRPLGCPFCGAYPTMTGDFKTASVETVANFDDEANHSSWAILCLNDLCLVQPDVDEPTQAEAIAAWNTRAVIGLGGSSALPLKEYGA